GTCNDHRGVAQHITFKTYSKACERIKQRNDYRHVGAANRYSNKNAENQCQDKEANNQIGARVAVNSNRGTYQNDGQNQVDQLLLRQQAVAVQTAIKFCPGNNTAGERDGTDDGTQNGKHSHVCTQILRDTVDVT